MNTPSQTRTLGRAAASALLVFTAALANLSCAMAQESPPAPATEEAAWPGDAEIDALAASEASAREDLQEIRNEAERTAGDAQEAAQLRGMEELPPGVERPSADRVKELQAEAREKQEAYWARYRDILGRFNSFLAEYPNNWEARDRLAWFYADFGDYLSASEQWRQVVALKADFSFGYNNLATVYNHLGRDMEAIDLYLKAIALKADEPEFHFNLANVLSTHRGEAAAKFDWDLPRVFRESLARYRRARELAPDNYEYAHAAASHFVLAHHFGVEDWADEAIADWRRCLELDLTDVQRSLCLTNLGRIYLRQKRDLAQARELLLEAKGHYSTPAIDTLLGEIQRVESRTTL